MTAINPQAAAPVQPKRRTSTHELYAELVARHAREAAELGHALSGARLQCGVYEAEIARLRDRIAELERAQAKSVKRKPDEAVVSEAD